MCLCPYCCWYCCYRYDLTRVQLLDAFLAEGLAALGGALPDEACERQLEQLLLSTAQSCLGYQGALGATQMEAARHLQSACLLGIQGLQIPPQAASSNC